MGRNGKRTRPAGVALLAVVHFLYGIGYCVLAIDVLQRRFDHLTRLSGPLAFVPSLLIGILGLFVGIGLWRLRMWAYIAAIIEVTVLLLTGVGLSVISSLFLGSQGLLLGAGLVVACSALLFYLRRRGVRNSFVRKEADKT